MAKSITLEDRLKASVRKAQKGESLVPDMTPPPAAEKGTIPDIRELISAAPLRLKLVRLTEEMGTLGEEEARIRKARTKLGDQIKKILGENKVGRAVVGDFQVNYFNAPRETLSVDKLLQNGVSPLIIARSKTMKDAYTLRISRVGEEEEEESE